MLLYQQPELLSYEAHGSLGLAGSERHMTESKDFIWITPYVPDDADLLTAIAEVTLHHSHLDHMLRMMVKSLNGWLRGALDRSATATN